MTYRTAKKPSFFNQLTAIGKRAHNVRMWQPVSIILANLRATA